jgi:hypothetical protein
MDFNPNEQENLLIGFELEQTEVYKSVGRGSDRFIAEMTPAQARILRANIDEQLERLED